MPDNYAVFGNPISHSKSPRIHSRFAEVTGEDIHYEAIFAGENAFAESINKFHADGGKGANVTVPFKEQAFALCDQLSNRAKLAGAVNTLQWDHLGRLYGDNTDGLGLVADLNRCLLTMNVSLVGKRVLLIGAGGAAKGAALPLCDAGIRELIVTNRTFAKAEQLVSTLKKLTSVNVLAATELIGAFDVVINSTSSSLSGDVPNIPSQVVSQSLCYDMMYSDKPTSFNTWAMENGALLAIDGVGMLVGQAAESFKLWRQLDEEQIKQLNTAIPVIMGELMNSNQND